MTKYRYFARTSLDELSPVAEQSWEQLNDRGGMGDELTYYPDRDCFEADDSIDLIPNPCSGEPLAGATRIIEELERWSRANHVVERF